MCVILVCMFNLYNYVVGHYDPISVTKEEAREKSMRWVVQYHYLMLQINTTIEPNTEES